MMAELRSRVEDPRRSLDVGEAGADGVEEFFRVLPRAGEVGPEGGSDLAATGERGERGQDNETDNMSVVHTRKFDVPMQRGKGVPAKS
jgi:hypothetical protein